MSPYYQSFARQSAEYTTVTLEWQSVAHRFLILFATVCVIIAYIVQVNSLALKGFQVNALEQQVMGLQKETRRLQHTVAEFQSSDEFTAMVTALGFVSEGHTEYLTLNPDAVAFQK